MTDTERERIIEAGKKAACRRTADPRRRRSTHPGSVSSVPDEGHSMTDAQSRAIEAYAQSVADAAPLLSDEQKTAVRRAVRAGRATEMRQKPTTTDKA